LPTAHVRIADTVYLHGARKNALLCAMAAGAPSCLTVTLLDGLVFARRAFSHSMNYRCAVLYGQAHEVTEPAEKALALAALVDHMAPGRSAQCAPPSEAELTATLVVALPITEGSAKVRKGPPLDAAYMHDAAHWSGVLPLSLHAGPAQRDPTLRDEVPLCAAVRARAAALGDRAHDAPELYERRRGELIVSTDRTRLDFDFVHGFLANESYWARGVDAVRQARAMRSALCFGLYQAARQIGFARVVTDYARVAYLADVFIAEDERHKGHGKWLIEQVLSHPALCGVSMWLLGTADAHGLYAGFGFVPTIEGRMMVRR
jgi:nitroimidazol reductase NimA-like FMN-containing flavoprotein (pyridoxamine 5'-phosphate oxidase superfamily)/GNAT superfamily N-acetyltransferase